MKQTFAEIEVEVNDVITPLSCSSMIIEFIKYIIYQKQLIPYPYERLEMCVNERKKQLSAFQDENNDPEGRVENPKESLASRKYFKKTATAHDSLENIFKIITDELTNSKYGHLEEVVLLLGSSFTNPQDVFRICIPRLSHAHSLKHYSTRKNCRSLFRTIINSEKFNDIVCGSCCTSSMRILLKMKPTNATANTDFIIPRAEFKLPTRGNQAVITFSPIVEVGAEGTSNGSCSCGRFSIFQDGQGTPQSKVQEGCCHLVADYLSLPLSSECTSCTLNTTSSSKSTNFGRWFQIKDTLKHFADVTVNDISMTDLWMNPNLTAQ